MSEAKTCKFYYGRPREVKIFEPSVKGGCEERWICAVQKSYINGVISTSEGSDGNILTCTAELELF